MPELIIQLLPLALTPPAALVPSGVQRGIVMGFAGLYFGGFVVLPNTPSVRMKKLEKYINETVDLHAIAIREVDRNPRFVTETSLRLAQIRLSESVIRSRMLGARDITAMEYIKHLRCLSFCIGGCQREVRDVRTSILSGKIRKIPLQLCLKDLRHMRVKPDDLMPTWTVPSTRFPELIVLVWCKEFSAESPVQLSAAPDGNE
ncbi:hypothetical protein DFH07DRAFT_766158 [Mycena maculata]|uniref:Uncharacterized protein n=1 Tax=Mycena maculata TaxID=230809 RepID=A0AAD7NVS6_9AGAR|nr:hypothetical protein DFH07DRAFT_766158 [Mycena maculata]